MIASDGSPTITQTRAIRINEKRGQVIAKVAEFLPTRERESVSITMLVGKRGLTKVLVRASIKARSRGMQGG